MHELPNVEYLLELARGRLRARYFQVLRAVTSAELSREVAIAILDSADSMRLSREELESHITLMRGYWLGDRAAAVKAMRKDSVMEHYVRQQEEQAARDKLDRERRAAAEAAEAERLAQAQAAAEQRRKTSFVDALRASA